MYCITRVCGNDTLDKTCSRLIEQGVTKELVHDRGGTMIVRDLRRHRFFLEQHASLVASCVLRTIQAIKNQGGGSS